MHLFAQFSLRNRALIALVTVIIAVFGGLSLIGLNQELAPSIQYPQLAVVTSYPGGTPEIVNSEISAPIEAAIREVPGAQETASVSTSSSSTVTATFEYGTNITFAEEKLTVAINKITGDLPDLVKPQIVARSTDQFPVIQIAVTGAPATSAISDELRQAAIPKLVEIDGVANANLLGDAGQRITITPDPTKLSDSGLTTESIKKALQQNGILTAAGTVETDDGNYSVQVGGRLAGVDDISKVPIVSDAEPRNAVPSETPSPSPTGSSPPAFPFDTASPSPSPTPTATPTGVVASTIGDVASVKLDNNPVTSLSRVNGEDALTLVVTKMPGANTVEVSEAVKTKIKSIKDSLNASYPNAKFTVVFDQAPFIQQSIAALTVEGLLGLGFAVLVILIFLFSFMATLATAIAIPISILITFIGLQTAQYSLNILTLGALTVAIGRVVDDSIVVVENIKRHLTSGVDKRATILRAVREVAGAITASTVTTVAVFIPLMFVAGAAGELFRPFALTITIALTASLFVALTIIPVLAYWFLKPAKANQTEKQDGVHRPLSALPQGAAVPMLRERDELGRPSRLQRFYLPILKFAVAHGFIIILFALLILGGTAFIAPKLKTNFIGSAGQNTFQVTQTLPNGASLMQLAQYSTSVEGVLQSTAGVKTVQTSIDTEASGDSAHQIVFSVTTDPKLDQEKLQDDVKRQLEPYQSGGAGEITVDTAGGFGSASLITVNVTSADDNDLQQASDDLTNGIRDIKGLSQVSSNLAASSPYISVTIDREKASTYGLTELELGNLVSAALQPQRVGSIRIDNKTLAMYIAPEEQTAGISGIQNITVPTNDGPVPLETFATVEQADGPQTISTIKGVRSVTITAKPTGTETGAVSAAIQKTVAKIQLPQGTTTTIGGLAADQNDAFLQLGIGLLVAILIVYVVMVATFKSLLQPLLLLIAVPFAATGAVGMLVGLDMPLGVPALIGLLMLVGIVVTNAIVLIDLVNQYRTRGMTVKEALIHGASLRLRPILMTALATVLALLPMAIGVTGESGFISQPLAVVVIGGLISSTLLTLIVLPGLYSLVEGRRDRRRARKAAQTGVPAVVSATNGKSSRKIRSVANASLRDAAKVSRTRIDAPPAKPLSATGPVSSRRRRARAEENNRINRRQSGDRSQRGREADGNPHTREIKSRGSNTAKTNSHENRAGRDYGRTDERARKVRGDKDRGRKYLDRRAGDRTDRDRAAVPRSTAVTPEVPKPLERPLLRRPQRDNGTGRRNRH